MTEHNDWMVDVETTGPCPGLHGVLSIGLVRFDRRTFEPTGCTLSDRLQLQSTTAWDERTAEFWDSQPPHTRARNLGAETVAASRISRRAEPLVPALHWISVVVQETGSPWFWAKPAHFDFPFVDQLFRSGGVDNPFHYRRVLDVRTWLMREPVSVQERAVQEGVVGEAHNPLDDCLSALAMLRSTLRVEETGR